MKSKHINKVEFGDYLADLNIKAAIAVSLAVIALLLTYIAFFK